MKKMGGRHRGMDSETFLIGPIIGSRLKGGVDWWTAHHKGAHITPAQAVEPRQYWNELEAQ